MEPKGYAFLFHALSDPTRVQIVTLLTAEKQCACQILSKVRVSQPTLSHHMRILCQAGLVVSEKNGRWVHYAIHEPMVQTMKDFLDSLGKAEPTLMGCPPK
jgi:ArsR family transcriptional regulator